MGHAACNLNEISGNALVLAEVLLVDVALRTYNLYFTRGTYPCAHPECMVDAFGSPGAAELSLCHYALATKCSPFPPKVKRS